MPLIESDLTVGSDDVGHDVKFFGATSGRYLLWDESADRLQFADNAYVAFGNGIDFTMYHNGTDNIIQSNSGHIKIVNYADDSDIILMSDNGSGGHTAYLTLDGSAGLTVSNVNMKFNDSISAVFGTGSDSLIRHTGSNMEITNTAGNIVIDSATNDADIIFKGTDGGADITALTLDMSDAGTAIFNHDIKIGDGDIIKIGDSADLYLSHDGANSHIVNGVGDLKITQNADDKDIIFNCDDGSGGNTAYLTLDGSAGHTVASKEILFLDNVLARFGSTNDFAITHNGTNTTFENSTGNLVFSNYADDADVIFQSDNGSGGVETYFFLDGSSGRTVFKDSKYLVFGTDNNLFLTHNGTDSYIQNYTSGYLYIDQQVDDADIVLRSDDGSGGITAYLTLDGSAGHTVANKEIQFLDSVVARFGTGNDFKIHHDGTNTLLVNDTGSIFIDNYADNAYTYFRNDNGAGSIATYFFLDGSAAVHDGSATTHLFTTWGDNSRIAVGTGKDFQMTHNGTNTFLSNNTGDLTIQNNTDDKDIIFSCDDGSGGTAAYLTLDGSISSIKVEKTMFVTDSTLLGVGGSSDLRMYHDGSDSFVENLTGDLTITCSTDDGKIIFQTDDESGGVETYVSINGLHGHTRFTKNTRHNDNAIASFGGGDDLEIQHDGSNSYISQGGTGNLYIQQNTNDADLILQCDDGSNGTTAYLTLDGSTSTIEVAKPTNFADDVTLTSAGSQQPLLTLKTTHTTKTASAELQFLKDAADTEDGENLGVITFYGEDEGNNNTKFAHIKGSIQESTNGQEGGSIKLAVVTHDGEMVNGLVINDGDAEDEIDVTIGSTATSMTTVAGNLTVNGAIISVGGSNADLNMNAGSDIVLEADNAGGGNTSSIQYLDAAGTNRIVLGVDGDVVQLCNRAANGTVTVKANTSTAGGGGETLVTTFADTEATFAVPVVLEADSTVGWHGSITRVKILPRDFQSDSGGRPAMTVIATNEAHLASNGSGKLFASVPIPTGFKATHVKIHGSDTGQTFTVYEANIANKTTSTKGTATAIETEKAITNVDSTTTNFILIEVSSDGTTDEIHGGYMTIAPI
jgi:hypothetical protein